MSASPRTSYAGQARVLVESLALAARHGAVGGTTVLAATGRLAQLLGLLAQYETWADDAANDAMAEERARYDATLAGTIVAFPVAGRARAITGGTAA